MTSDSAEERTIENGTYLRPPKPFRAVSPQAAAMLGVDSSAKTRAPGWRPLSEY